MRNKVFIGTDEAGYGPNLGPLVVTATSWTAPADLNCADLWSHLSDVLTNAPVRNDPRLFVADSKQVYSPSNGLVDLETAVLSLLGTIHPVPATTMKLGLQVVGKQFREQCLQDPTLQAMSTTLPVAAFPDEIAEFRQSLKAVFQSTGIQLRQVRSRVVFPGEFNSLIHRAGSKGVVLSNSTLQLIHELCPSEFRTARQSDEPRHRQQSLFSMAQDDEVPTATERAGARQATVTKRASVQGPAGQNAADGGASYTLVSRQESLTDAEMYGDVPIESVHVYCDKHGGRNRYDALISEHFDDQFVFRCEEGAAISRYRLGRTEFCFRTRAEEFLPVAVASMVSKYLRETLMEDFNLFWRGHLPDLKPTKGYPLDARRFRDAIQETADRLGIPETLFWRQK